VLDVLELLQRPPPHPLSRRLGDDQLRVRRLQLAQLVEQRVVLVVADLGIVEDVVAMVVMLDLAAQLVRARRRTGGAHSPIPCAAGRSSRSS
jgi:hypothetical protein